MDYQEIKYEMFLQIYNNNNNIIITPNSEYLYNNNNIFKIDYLNSLSIFLNANNKILDILIDNNIIKVISDNERVIFTEKIFNISHTFNIQRQPLILKASHAFLEDNHFRFF